MSEPGPPLLHRTGLKEWLETDDVLLAHTGLTGEWIASAIESAYETMDTIDEELVRKSAEPLSQMVELANLSSMVGNILGAGLAETSGGTFKRNRPHAYPDLVSLRPGVEGIEIKMALETNKPKGHLPKSGLHITFRYVLGSRDGHFERGRENRGDTVWVWESRVGVLTPDDYDLSNTPGDSGKTAVIKTQSFRSMQRIFYVPRLLPYARRGGWYGDP